MHAQKWVFTGMALMLLASTGVAQDAMLNAFDNPNTVPGIIVVSFSQDVSRAEAEAVLQKFGLGILIEERCVTESYGGPGQTPVSTKTCGNVDSWNEDIKLAHVKVPIGSEKEIAAQVIEDPGIIYVEPLYTASATGEDNEVEDPQAGIGGPPNGKNETGLTSSAFMPFVVGVIGVIILVLVGGWFFIVKKPS